MLGRLDSRSPLLICCDCGAPVAEVGSVGGLPRPLSLLLLLAMIAFVLLLGFLTAAGPRLAEQPRNQPSLEQASE